MEEIIYINIRQGLTTMKDNYVLINHELNINVNYLHIPYEASTGGKYNGPWK